MFQQHLLLSLSLVLLTACHGYADAQLPTQQITLRVGPTHRVKLPSTAAQIAKDGWLIEIEAGHYPGDVAIWRQNNLVLRGINGRAQLKARGQAAQGKAIWVIKGNNTNIENIEFSGARVPDRNGAGIRLEGTHLSIRNSYFYDNEMGILTGRNPDSEILIENSEFAFNTVDYERYGRLGHNIYIGAVQRLVLRNNFIHDAHIGHNVKSRARENYILYNRIMDDKAGSSYLLDLPNGGHAYIIGNVFRQSRRNDNHTLIAFAAERNQNVPDQSLYVVNNTFVNDDRNSIFILNKSSTPATLINNIFAGPGQILKGPRQSSNNLISHQSVFIDRARYDYRLRKNSAAIDQGRHPGTARNGFVLKPEAQTAFPQPLQARPQQGQLDIGAYEYVPVRAQSTEPKRAATNKSKPYRLPSVDVKQRILWGSTARTPEGLELSFGGQDQASEDGRPRTRIKVAGQWQSLAATLRAANPLQSLHAKIWAVRNTVKNQTAKLRYVFFQGQPQTQQNAVLQNIILPILQDSVSDVEALDQELQALGTQHTDPYFIDQIAYTQQRLHNGQDHLRQTLKQLSAATLTDAITSLWPAQIALEQAAEAVDAEPPARALSPLIYDPHTQLFVLFGGDHLDYLTNDTWVFDPKRQRWEQRHPPSAPPPRANHVWSLAGASLHLAGGYHYFNALRAMEGPYLNHDDGAWQYNVAQNIWISHSDQPTVSANRRTYREKWFHPLHYLNVDRPDARQHDAHLQALPVNTWVRMDPPLKPRINRDWGSATHDSAQDLLLRFSGGHSAHGGSDVIMYHFATNRWELPFPVEFPLGQTYSNTAYPRGYNFNLRPWIHIHSYKHYGYDASAELMLFNGQKRWFYWFDSRVGDWTGRAIKPEPMDYRSPDTRAPVYSLTCTATPKGQACWNARGEVLRYDHEQRQWQLLALQGERLIGSRVDHSGIVFDSKRDRLLFIPKGKRRTPFSGAIYELDMKTLVVSRLNPHNADRAGVTPTFFRELVYLPKADLVLNVAAVLSTSPQGRDLLAYDCADNRWLAVTINGPSVLSERELKGRRFGVSLGAVYDPKRDFIWITTTHSEVYALRFDRATAVVKAL